MSETRVFATELSPCAACGGALGLLLWRVSLEI